MSSERSFRERAKSARRSITASVDGRRSLGSSMTGASVSQNNAAERALRGVAQGRKNWLFAGSDEGGRRAAAVYSLIETCKLNDVDPQAWLAHVLVKLPDHPAKNIDDLLPWRWKAAERATGSALAGIAA